MSTKATQWAWKAQVTHHSHRLVLLALASLVSPIGSSCYPSITEISRLTGLCRMSIQKAIAALEDAGHIGVIRPPGQSCFYQLEVQQDASKEVGTPNPDGAVMNRMACESDGGFFTSGAPNYDGPDGETARFASAPLDLEPRSGCHPSLQRRATVFKPLLEHHMSQSALVPVQFHGASLFVTTINGAPHVAMRPIVEAIGLQWEGQLQRIKRHPVLNATMCVTHMVAEDGKNREVVCLPLDKLNGWLFGVTVSRVKPELREKLTRYQAECFDVLAQHFGAVQPPVAAPAPPPKRNVIRCKVESVSVTMRLTSGGVGFGIRLQGDHYNMHRFAPGESIELEYAQGATPLADLPIGVNRIAQNGRKAAS